MTWLAVGEGVRKLLAPDKTSGCCILMDKAPIHFLLGLWAASVSHIGAAASLLFFQLRPSLNVVKQCSQGWGRDGEWVLVEGGREMGIKWSQIRVFWLLGFVIIHQLFSRKQPPSLFLVTELLSNHQESILVGTLPTGSLRQLFSLTLWN